MLKRIVVIILLLLISSSGYAAASENQIVKAQVIGLQDISSSATVEKIVAVRLLEGQHKDQQLEIRYAPIYASRVIDLRIGQKLNISLYEENGVINGYINSIDRSDYIIQLLVIFIIVVIIFGRLRGISSLVSLGVSGVIIIKIIIPLIIQGHNPIGVTVISSVSIIVISFILIGGFTKKSFTAIISTSGGTIIAGLLANYYTHLAALTGTATEEATYLMTELGLTIDFRGLFMCGIIIGTLGAIMDVSMSISSCIFEIYQHSPRVSLGKLAASGFNVGKDIMSTMTNTLILAYAGASMPLFLIFFNSKITLDILSTDIIAGEIIRSLCGSIGLVLTIPLTVLVACSMVGASRY